MRSYLVYLVARAAMLFFRWLPRVVAHPLLDMLASAAYYIDARHRRIADVNLRIAFPELDARGRRRIAQLSFRNTARNLLEIARMPRLTRDSIASLVEYDPDQGLANCLAARAMGKGILYLTGHFSAWELLPAAHAVYGYPLSFVTRPLDNPALERYLTRMREMHGNRVIPKKNAARQILEVLRAGGDVGVLVDQNTTLQEGMFADLFGLPAATTTSFARLALHTGATVLPGYIAPMRDGRYRVKFRPPVDLIRTGDLTRDIEENTRMLNLIVESIIREQPESWLWGHKRWKNRPPGQPDLYALTDGELQAFLARERKPAAEGVAGNQDSGRQKPNI
ncbi:MAG: lysophospholipid acyltransferase family protein [Acidobacteria bacterium]|nr:lysophospholipid acyltransferase family protein [Acidobacteriota bacterium]